MARLKPNTVTQGRLSPLKTMQELPRIEISFDIEQSGKSVATLCANKDMLRIWFQFWSEPGRENYYEFKDYTVDSEVKDKGDTINLSVRMKSKKSGNASQVTIKKISQTVMRIESKKNAIESTSLLGKILYPMLWTVMREIRLDDDVIVEVKGEEGKATCRVCPSPQVSTLPCSCCDQHIHQKCSRNKSCKNICKKLQVQMICKDRDELELKGNGESNFYRRLIAAMRKNVKKVSKKERIKRNEEELKKLTETNRHVAAKADPPVVTTAIPTLKNTTNDAIGAFETQCLVKGDERMRKFVGKKIEAEKEK